MAQAGDVVRVGAGIYAENVSSARNGSSGSRIVIDGQGVAQIQSFLFGNTYNTLQNMTVIGKRAGWWTFLTRGANYNIISNNIYDGQYDTNMGHFIRWENPAVGTAPFGSCASGCTVVSNLLKRGFQGTYIAVFGDTNVIHGNTLIDGDTVDWFNVWGRSNIISANLCSNLFIGGSAQNHPDWFQTFGNNGYGSRGHIFESNVVAYADGDAQLMMTSADGVSDITDLTFRNNIFMYISRPGMVNIPDVKFYNNTFYKCSTNHGTVISGWGSAAGYAHSLKIINNAFIDCGTGSTNDGWYQVYGTVGLTNCTADYNMVSIAGQSPRTDPQQRFVGNPGGWDRFYWWEPHGIAGGDARFVNRAAGNFHLLASSPLIGAGTNLNALFTVDLEGRTRGALWDIGALEFQAGDTVSLPAPPSKLLVRLP